MEFDETGVCVPSKGFKPKVVVSISVGAFIAIGVVVLIFRKFLRRDRRIENVDEKEKDDKSKNEKDEENSKKEIRVGSNESETAL